MDFDSLKDKAEQLASEHSDQVEQGLDKAADFAKDKVDGHDGEIDAGVDKAKDFLGGLGN